MQHLIVQTSDPVPLKFNKGWFENDAGFQYNTKFGFGLMDATKLVTTALEWTNVPHQEKCVLRNFQLQNFVKQASILFNNYVCGIRYLEHVQVQVNTDYYVRGVLSFTVYSPRGTEAQLLLPRRNDKSMKGFRDWTFLSLATWGEDPRGTWRLNCDIFDDTLAEAQLFNTTLILYGISKHFEPKHSQYNIIENY